MDLTPSEHRLAELIWNTSRADEGTISVTGAQIVAKAILDSGWFRDRLLDAEHGAKRYMAAAWEDGWSAGREWGQGGRGSDNPYTD